ncbi:alpha-amylase family glycosyl hydrolase [Cohnella cellulosilytica]|uniref:Alpha-amylase family glycosyl hydrolase n=1 Tax=Cohnella cellulosilytica TaxID=986710 RepID=A0ABW2FHC5_9BACL
MRNKPQRLLAISLLLATLGLSACTGADGEDGATDTVAKTTEKEGSAMSVSVPAWSERAVMYEVNVRQYTKEGTFRAFAEHLPRLQELGVDMLWLMPIHPISQTKRNGTLGSYYAVQDYKAVNPEFGTKEDFKALVDRAHELGFKVVLDWVANHTGWDHEWLVNPGWYTTDEAGNIVQPPGTNWTDTADLNYANADMRAAMLDAMRYWVEEFDIDGYRCDYAGGVPVDFWEEARAALERIKPVYLLAEDDQQLGLLRHAFNANYGWRLYNLMNGIAKGQGQSHVEQLHRYAERLASDYPKGAYPLHFTSNHDENSWTGTEYERLGPAVETMAVLSFTMPGMPLIYSGQEAGLDRRLAFFEKDEIGWDDLPLQSFYRTLADLKHGHPALWNGVAGGSYERLESGGDPVLAFVRKHEDSVVIVLANLSGEPAQGKVRTDAFAGAYEAFPDGESVTLAAELTVDLQPWEYRIYTASAD